MQPFSRQGPVHTAATSASQALSDIWAANSATDPAWDTQNRDRSFCALRILFLLAIITEVNNTNCTQQNLMWLKIAVPRVFSGYPQGWGQRGQRYVRNKHLPAATFFSRAQSASTENKVAFPSGHFNIKKIQSTAFLPYFTVLSDSSYANQQEFDHHTVVADVQERFAIWKRSKHDSLNTIETVCVTFSH